MDFFRIGLFMINKTILYTNDVLDGKFAVCVQLDLETGETRAFNGPVRHCPVLGTRQDGYTPGLEQGL